MSAAPKNIGLYFNESRPELLAFTNSLTNHPRDDITSIAIDPALRSEYIGMDEYDMVCLLISEEEISEGNPLDGMEGIYGIYLHELCKHGKAQNSLVIIHSSDHNKEPLIDEESFIDEYSTYYRVYTVRSNMDVHAIKFEDDERLDQGLEDSLRKYWNDTVVEKARLSRGQVLIVALIVFGALTLLLIGIMWHRDLREVGKKERQWRVDKQEQISILLNITKALTNDADRDVWAEKYTECTNQTGTDETEVLLGALQAHGDLLKALKVTDESPDDTRWLHILASFDGCVGWKLPITEAKNIVLEMEKGFNSTDAMIQFEKKFPRSILTKITKWPDTSERWIQTEGSKEL